MVPLVKCAANKSTGKIIITKDNTFAKTLHNVTPCRHGNVKCQFGHLEVLQCAVRRVTFPYFADDFFEHVHVGSRKSWPQ